MTERHDHEQRLAYLSRFDGLTGEMNRNAITEILKEALEDAVRYRGSCGFLLVAVDNLARINESYGFGVADEVIASVGRRIRSRMRGADMLGRVAGNKFGIVLKNATPDDLSAAADRFLAAVREDVVQTEHGAVAATVTIGGVAAPRHARTVEEILAHAQESLDSAKAKRRGSFVAYRPNIEREAVRKENARSTDEIVAALNERRIVLAFEPVVTTAKREAAFYECLMRIRRGDGTLVPASAVIPIAENLGLVRLIDHRVMELLIAEMVASPSLTASLNVSPDSATDPDWWASLGAHLRSRPGLAQRLIIEITETAAIQDACQGPRLPHRDRRFRRRPYLVPQSARARRGHHQDRRRVRAESHPLGGRPRVRAHADRAWTLARPEDRCRMGAGGSRRRDAGELGVRLPPGRLHRPRQRRLPVGAARRCGDRHGPLALSPYPCRPGARRASACRRVGA